MNEIMESLKQTPMEVWQGLLGALAGAFIAFIGGALTNSSNRKSLNLQLEHTERLQSQQHHRERLEELYVLVSEWANGMRNSNNHMVLLMKGLIQTQEYIDSINAPENEVDFNRVEMLVGIYGDSVKAAFNDVLTIRNDISKVLSLCFDSLEKGTPNSELVSQIEDKAPLFNTAMKKLQSEIVKAAKEV